MEDVSALKMLSASEPELEAFSDDEWRGLILYLVDLLQTHFGGRIVTESLENAWMGGIGFCLYISNANESPNTPMSWKGILGATTVDGKLHVSLTVFFYSGDKRLVAKLGEGGMDGRGGKEFAEYVLDSSEEGVCRWKLLDWFDDVYGEYDNF
ncbi:hypothetical protein [Aeoliella sp. SH292]|uniref:hypothetical protein n=1 Tax=Aeoliella sp. SH292 TaxID=3454464 RepID=UPI003F9B24C4